MQARRTQLDNHSQRQAKSEGETIQSDCGRSKYSHSAYGTVVAVDEDGDDEDEADEDDEEDAGLCLMPVDRLICPLAAHGGGVFGRAEL